MFPYTDRLNYISPMLNNVGYAMAVEKLLGIDEQIPERAQYIRVIVGEVSRITRPPDLPGRQRDGAGRVHRLPVRAQGARVAVRAARRGVRRAPDATLRAASAASPTTCRDGFDAKLRDILARTRIVMSDIGKLLERNRIFRDRMDGIGIITKDDALAYGITGPVGRSTGLAYDVRKDHPYLVYDRFDFDVPVGSDGDNFDRYAVRVEEMQQSMRILEQALEADPGRPGDGRRSAHRAAAQERDLQLDRGDDRATSSSSWTASTCPPGEVYSFTEARQRRARLLHRLRRHRPPVEVPRAPALLRGDRGAAARCCPASFIADIVPTFGMINMIGGECDR